MLTRNFDNMRTYTIYKEAGSNKIENNGRVFSPAVP